jgi:hypothetical protein
MPDDRFNSDTPQFRLAIGAASQRPDAIVSSLFCLSRELESHITTTNDQHSGHYVFSWRSISEPAEQELLLSANDLRSA